MNAKNVNSALKSKSVLQTHTTYVHNICNHFKGDTNSMKFYKNEEKSEDWQQYSSFLLDQSFYHSIDTQHSMRWEARCLCSEG